MYLYVWNLVRYNIYSVFEGEREREEEWEEEEEWKNIKFYISILLSNDIIEMYI